MRLRVLTSAVVLVAVLVLITGWVVSRDRSGASGEGRLGKQILEDAEKAAEPGKHHANLKPLVGTWNVVLRRRRTPDAPWEESTSTAGYEWIMGSRFLLQKVRGKWADNQPFEGMGILGYDRVRRKHTSVWVDNSGTVAATSEGTCNQSGNVITLYREYTDPMTGGTKRERSVLRITSNNEHVFEIHETGPEGQEFQSFEMTYTRNE